MLCDFCKENEATVHFSQVAGDKVRKIDICEACAKAKGFTDPSSISMLGDLLGEFATDQMMAGAEGLRCPECGFTQANFKKTGRLGCAACYDTFDAGLRPLLKAMHKGERHIGKVPRKSVQVSELTERLKALEKDLAQAVKEERYEQAANLRDEMRALEARLRSDVKA